MQHRRFQKHLLFGVSIAILLLLFLTVVSPSEAGTIIQNVAKEVKPEDTCKLPEVTKEMRDYCQIGYALYFAYFVYMLTVRFGLLQSGLNNRLRNWAESKTDKPALQFLLYYFSLYSLMGLIVFPFTVFSDFALEHQFKLTDQPLSDWFLEYCKSFVIGFIFALPTLGGYFWLVRKFKKWWAIYFWLIVCVWSGIDLFISPYVVEPLFNKYTVMQPGPLKTKIDKLAQQAGIPNPPILIADKSHQTKTFNAHVSGIGPSARIIIWDTTLGKLPDDQLLAVVGHELGHYYYRHALINYLILIAENTALVPVNMFLLEPVVARLPKRWGIRNLRDFALIPALCLGSSIPSMLSEPIYNMLSRTQEHQADAFAKRVTGDGPAMARALVTVYKQDLSEPDPQPFIQFWMFGHPSLKQRFEFALSDDTE